MSDTPKKVTYGSMGVAGIVALMAISDMVVSVPFAGFSIMFDVLMLLSAAAVLYLGWETLKELR